MGRHMPGWNESRCARSRWDSICQVGMSPDVLGLDGTAYARLEWKDRT